MICFASAYWDHKCRQNLMVRKKMMLKMMVPEKESKFPGRGKDIKIYEKKSFENTAKAYLCMLTFC